jgi:hypothetical protein
MRIFTRVYIILLIVLISILTGCTNEDSIKDIAEDDLLVKHWYDLDEEQKITIFENAMDEGNIYMNTEGNEEYINFQIGSLGQAFLNQSFKDLNLKKAIISFMKEGKIIEPEQ